MFYLANLKPLFYIDKIRHDTTTLKSLEYIESHYREQITIQDLAANVYLNKDYFIRKFKQSMGMTPYAYLSQLRFSIAGELISNGHSLAEAAAETGFQFPSSLCHALKKFNPEVIE